MESEEKFLGYLIDGELIDLISFLNEKGAEGIRLSSVAGC